MMQTMLFYNQILLKFQLQSINKHLIEAHFVTDNKQRSTSMKWCAWWRSRMMSQLWWAVALSGFRPFWQINIVVVVMIILTSSAFHLVNILLLIYCYFYYYCCCCWWCHCSVLNTVTLIVKALQGHFTQSSINTKSVAYSALMTGN